MNLKIQLKTEKSSMRKYFITLIVFAFTLLPLFGQATQYQKANDWYAKGQYKMAADLYERILKEEGVAPEIYYNLGNSYYKLNETGLAVLNYERALKLSPGYENARVNLELAQTRVVDNIHQISPFFVIRWFEIIIKSFTTNQWLFFSAILFTLAIVLVLSFIFSFSSTLRKGSFYAALVIFILSMSTLVFSYVRKTVIDESKDAIIMSGAVTVKSSPDKSGTNLFQIHEGTKVKVQSSLGNWTEIKLGNGNIGWIENSNFEII